MQGLERLRFHRSVGLPAYPHVDTPTAGTRRHDRGVRKMLNPHVDAQTIDVWKHTRTITQMLSRRVDAERCVTVMRVSPPRSRYFWTQFCNHGLGLWQRGFLCPLPLELALRKADGVVFPGGLVRSTAQRAQRVGSGSTLRGALGLFTISTGL